MALHWSGVGAAPLMSPRQDETSEPLLYAGWMVGPYRCKDATRGRNDDPVTSGVWNYVASQPKKRGTSKDVVASLDQRVAGVETSMAELKNQEEGLEGLDSDFTSMREDFRVALNTLSGDLKREIHGLRDSFMGRDPQVRKEFGDEQFYPKNTKNEAKSRLRKLKQSGTIREYVKEFTTLVLEIPELSDQDSLFYFLTGLQGWAKTELERQGAQDLSMTIAYAEALIDFSMRRESSKLEDQKVNQEKGRGEKNAQSKVDVARLKYQIFMT
ncbi:putative retrotransposon gag domain, aspartic peptidase domain protein [Tanacetum coccineum]